MTSAAHVEVALVVRNELARIQGALDVLRAQRGVSLAITVHDSASTDGTAERADAIARLDARVTVVRHERDLGILHNFVRACAGATAPRFAWAAADDRRDPDHLASLLAHLDAHPEAALAATAARVIGADGATGPVLEETLGLDGAGLIDRPAPRLAAWLRRAPCVPFYGLYRTDRLHPLLPVLSALADPPEHPQLRADAVFLAHLAARHPIVIDPTPRFDYRLGGASDAIERFERLRDLANAYRAIARGFRDAAHATNARGFDRMRLLWARHRQLLHLMTNGPGRRRLGHACTATGHGLESLAATIAARTDPALRRLARRVRGDAPGARIILAGGGKHTRRRLAALRAAMRGRAEIVAIADDAPGSAIGGLPVVPFEAVAELADVVVASSDACEELLLARARAAAPRVPAWPLYGPDDGADVPTADLA